MDTIYYYTYNCQSCDDMCEVGFYETPHKLDSFTCDANGKEHDLLICDVDNDNMTLDVDIL